MKWNDFEAEISKHIGEFKKDPEYLKWLENKVWNKLYSTAPLNEQDIDEIIKFLDSWGKMMRVNGKIKKQIGKKEMYKQFINVSQMNQSLFPYLKNLKR